jgi:uncharacterized integral membrane protein
MNRFRYLAVVALTAAVLVFAAQNLHSVAVQFLIWELHTSVALITLVPFLVGLLVALLGRLLFGRRRRQEEPDAPDGMVSPAAAAVKDAELP